MLEPSHKTEKNWYFITDGVSLKVTNSITIGEDADGVLALESSDAEERWLTCSVESGELLVEHLHEQFRIELPGSWSTRKPGAMLESGMVIVLPNNEVYIGESAVRGEVEERIYVTFNADVEAAAVSRRYGAQPLSASRKVSATLPPRRSGVGTEGIGEHLLPKKKGAAAAEDEPVVAPPSLQAIRSGTGRQESAEAGRPGSERAGPGVAPIIMQERKVRRRNSNRGLEILAWFMAVVAFALVVAVASNYYRYSQARTALATDPPRVDTQAGMSDLLQAPGQELSIATGPEAAQSLELGTELRTELATTAEPATHLRDATSNTSEPGIETGGIEEILAPDSAGPVETAISGPSASAPENVDPKSAETTDSLAGSGPTGPELTRRELAQARTLMARGYLNWPETNAMSILSQILDREPNNLVARNMLIDCAERLLADARRAHADGFVDTALVQVEKLLKVYPLYLPALDQQSEWQQRPNPQDYR